MNEIAGLIVPFFGLILLGYGSGRLGFVRPGSAGALNFFVLYLAMPALFFQLVATTPLSNFAGVSFLVTTTFATYIAFALAFSAGALLNRGNVSEATVQGLIGSYSNLGYMAPALTIAAFGSAAAMPTALIFTFDTALIFIVTPLMMTLGGTVKADFQTISKGVARQIFLHPLIIATIAGLLLSATGLGLPGPVNGLLSSLRVAAVPCALFLTGLSLSQRQVDSVPVEMPILIGIKLVVHPAIVYLLLSWVGGFDRIWVYVAVLMAALPPAAQVHGIARRFGTYEERAGAAIALATVVAISSLTIILILLLRGILPLEPFR